MEWRTMGAQDHDVYPPEFLAMLQTTWGEGFLSPGGVEEVKAIVADIDVAGKSVLDIGSGLGGPSFALVRDCGAATVTGVEVQGDLVQEATRIAEGNGLAGAIAFVTVDGCPLQFPDASFDIAFSKDSIIHVPDKQALYGEAKRVLKPGGWLAISDWFCGAAPFSEEMIAWLEATGLSFALKPIADTATLLEQVGFHDIEAEDRNAWSARQASVDVERLSEGLEDDLAAIIGSDAAAVWRRRSEKRALVAQQRHLRPGHIRARV